MPCAEDTAVGTDLGTTAEKDKQADGDKDKNEKAAAPTSSSSPTSTSPNPKKKNPVPNRVFIFLKNLIGSGARVCPGGRPLQKVLW